MKYCSSCGAELKDTALFCSRCGRQQSINQEIESTKKSNALKMVLMIAIPVLLLGLCLTTIHLVKNHSSKNTNLQILAENERKEESEKNEPIVSAFDSPDDLIDEYMQATLEKDESKFKKIYYEKEESLSVSEYDVFCYLTELYDLHLSQYNIVSCKDFTEADVENSIMSCEKIASGKGPSEYYEKMRIDLSLIKQYAETFKDALQKNKQSELVYYDVIAMVESKKDNIEQIDLNFIIKKSSTEKYSLIGVEAIPTIIETEATKEKNVAEVSTISVNGTVKIGVFEPLSGDNGAGGKQEILGMQYANKETPTVEVGGKTYNVELVYADNASSNDNAPSAAQTLVSNGVSCVLGSYGSGVSIAAGDTFKNAGVPAIGVTCTNPMVTLDCDVYFRICYLDSFQGTILANYAKNNLGAKKAYCLAKQGDDYSGGLVKYFIEAFGAENCVVEVFPEETSDYSTYITNAQNNGCDVFFAPVYTDRAIQIIDNAIDQSLKIPILAGDTWDSGEILYAAKGSNLNISVTTFYCEGANEKFDSGFKDWLNSDSKKMRDNGGFNDIRDISAMGYDAYYFALEAIKNAGSTDTADILRTLPTIKYTGITGSFSLNEYGDANRDSGFIKACNTETGKWFFVEKTMIR